MIKLEHGRQPHESERADLRSPYPLRLPSAALIEEHRTHWQSHLQEHELAASGLVREVPEVLIARLNEAAVYRQLHDQPVGRPPRATIFDAQRRAASALGMSSLMRLPAAAATMETSLATADEQFVDYAFDQGDDLLRLYVAHGREGNFVENYSHAETDGPVVWYEHQDDTQRFFVRTEQTVIDHVTDDFLGSYIGFFGDEAVFDPRAYTTITPITSRQSFDFA
jgi:hypothetical protein